MSVAEFVGRMRERQADLFTTTVTVTHQDATGTFDPATASYDLGAATTVYTGPALVRPQIIEGSIDVLTAGETTAETDTYRVKFPVDTALVVGDLVTVTGSTYDAGLVGITMRVLTVGFDEWQITRQCLALAETGRPV